MKILIADKLSDRAVKALEELGAGLRVEPELGADDLAGSIADAEVLIVRSTKVGEAALRAGKNLSLVIRAGAGVNTIDLDTASSLGIHVANCPGKNADAVAELAAGLMIALDRNIVENCLDLRQGVWNKKLYSKARGLKGRTLGILGLGSIGMKLMAIGQAMEMQVAAWSRSLSPEKAEELGIIHCADPLSLARISDVISVHLAAAPETENLIDTAFLEAMKDGAYLINTARGEIIDEKALRETAPRKGLKLALDVYRNEPPASAREFPDRELAELVYGTHHIGASTDQASEAIADEVVNIVRAYRDSGRPLHVVNAREKSTAEYNLVVRHFNKVGVLAGVLDELRTARINVEEMENAIFSGGKAAVCTLKLDSQPDATLVERIGAMEYIIRAQVK